MSTPADKRELPDLELSGFEANEAPPPPMISGKLVVSVVAAIGVIGAAAGWLYHYDQKRLPRTFWGFESPRIFAESQTVTALLLKPEVVSTEPKPQWYPELYLIDGLRYVVVKKIDVTDRPEVKKGEEPDPSGKPNVRQLLVDYHSFDSSEKRWREPDWRFGLIFENVHDLSGAKYTASIVFDSEAKLGRPQTVDKAISTTPMSAQLMTFFNSVFPEAASMPRSSVQPQHAYTQPLQTPGAATPQTGPQFTTAAPGSPSAPGGPSALGSGPVVVPMVPLPPALGGPSVPGGGLALPGGFTLPGSTPGGASPGVTVPLNFGGPAIPGLQSPRPGAFPGGPPAPLDFSAPKNVIVPKLEGSGPPNASGT